MESFIFFISLSSILLSTEAAKSTPSTVKCSGSSIGIRFPFRIKPEHSGHRRHAGFELHCKENHTVIHFPSQGDLVVKSISYDDKRLDLLDPKRCVHEVFLNLNLSDTPFDYYHTLKKYTYLKCSAKLPPPLQPVPCLSGSGYHVYTVDPRLAEQVSCMVIKTVGIPFPYSSYLSDNSFGLRLTWDLPGLQSELGWSASCYHKSHPTVLGIGILMLSLLVLITRKVYHFNQSAAQKKVETRIEVERLLGDYRVNQQYYNIKGLTQEIRNYACLYISLLSK